MDEASVTSTLGTVLKYREDQERVVAQGLPEMVLAAITRGEA